MTNIVTFKSDQDFKRALQECKKNLEKDCRQQHLLLQKRVESAEDSIQILTLKDEFGPFLSREAKERLFEKVSALNAKHLYLKFKVSDLEKSENLSIYEHALRTRVLGGEPQLLDKYLDTFGYKFTIKGHEEKNSLLAELYEQKESRPNLYSLLSERLKEKLTMRSGKEEEFKELLFECARYCKGSEFLLIDKKPALFTLLRYEEFEKEGVAKSLTENRANPFGERFKFNPQDYPKASSAVLKVVAEWVSNSKSKILKSEMEKQLLECETTTKKVEQLQNKFLESGYRERVSNAYNHKLYYEKEDLGKYIIASNLATYQSSLALIQEFETERDEFVEKSSSLKRSLYAKCADSKKRYMDDLFETEERNLILDKKELTIADAKRLFSSSDLKLGDMKKMEERYPDLYLFTEEKRDEFVNERSLALFQTYKPEIDAILNGSFYQESSVNINYTITQTVQTPVRRCTLRRIFRLRFWETIEDCVTELAHRAENVTVKIVKKPNEFLKSMNKDLKDVVKSVKKESISLIKESPRKIGKEADRGSSRVKKEAKRTAVHVGDAVVDGVKLTKTAMAKAEREGLRLSADAIHVQKAAILGTLHPLTSQVKTLQVLDRLVVNAINIQQATLNYTITSGTHPTKLLKVETHRALFNDVKKELSAALHEGVVIHNKSATKFGDEFLRRIHPDLDRALEQYIKAVNTGEKVANAVTTFENAVRIAAVTAGSACFPPVGSAVANVMVDKYVLKKSMTEKDMLESFAVGLAAGYAASYGMPKNDPSYLQSLRGALQRDLTKAIGKKIVYDDNYTEKEFLIDLMTAAVTITPTNSTANANPAGEAKELMLERHYLEKVSIGAANGASSNLVVQVVNTGKVNKQEAFEAALTGAGNSAIEESMRPEMTQVGEKIQESIVGLYVGLTEIIGFGGEASQKTAQLGFEKLSKADQKKIDEKIESQLNKKLEFLSLKLYNKNLKNLSAEELSSPLFTEALQKMIDTHNWNDGSEESKKLDRSIASFTDEELQLKAGQSGRQSSDALIKAVAYSVEFLQRSEVQKALEFIELASLAATVMAFEVSTAGMATPFIAAYLGARFGALTITEGAAIIKGITALTGKKGAGAVEILKIVDKGAESPAVVKSVIESAGKLGIRRKEEIQPLREFIAKITSGDIKKLERMNKVINDAGDVANSAVSRENLWKQLASESQITEKGTVIAGGSSSTLFRNAEYAAQKYGGVASDYIKKTSSAYKLPDGKSVSTHWVENIKTGERFEAKTIIE